MKLPRRPVSEKASTSYRSLQRPTAVRRPNSVGWKRDTRKRDPESNICTLRNFCVITAQKNGRFDSFLGMIHRNRNAIIKPMKQFTEDAGLGRLLNPQNSREEYEYEDQKAFGDPGCDCHAGLPCLVQRRRHQLCRRGYRFRHGHVFSGRRSRCGHGRELRRACGPSRRRRPDHLFDLCARPRYRRFGRQPRHPEDRGAHRRQLRV